MTATSICHRFMAVARRVFVLLAFTGSLATADPRLKVIAAGLNRPLFMADPADGTRRLFIVEQRGTVRILSKGRLLPTPFLSLTSKVSKGSEQGLLGFAFDPNFKVNRRVFVNYTRGDGSTVVSSLIASRRSPNQVDAASERVRLVFSQPFDNHNGGHLTFGPDGLLYIGSGDGGSGGDPQGNGQNLTTLLGKLLRIDVSGPRGYSIPQSNPFRGVSGARPEIFAYGLRNPWRFSIDRRTGRIFVGDVGQSSEEEVSIIKAGDNLGWNITEGSSCFAPRVGCSVAGLTLPINSYGRGEGGSVTGGYVYRGRRLPGFRGKYIFGDFSSGTVFALSEKSDGSWSRETVFESERLISSFAEDRSGEVYLVDYSGELLAFVP
jgi:glucose/arabinose dehydrogenase